MNEFVRFCMVVFGVVLGDAECGCRENSSLFAVCNGPVVTACTAVGDTGVAVFRSCTGSVLPVILPVASSVEADVTDGAECLSPSAEMPEGATVARASAVACRLSTRLLLIALVPSEWPSVDIAVVTDGFFVADSVPVDRK